jgi:hypothetical protein
MEFEFQTANSNVRNIFEAEDHSRECDSSQDRGKVGNPPTDVKGVALRFTEKSGSMERRRVVPTFLAVRRRRPRSNFD